MKELKIIGGVICVILAVVAFGGAFNGAPLMFSGVFIWGIIAFLLFNSASKSNPKLVNEEKYNFKINQPVETNSKKENTNFKVIRQKEESPNPSGAKNVQDDIQAKTNSLYELKESGILDEIEFEEKIKLLKEQKLNHLLENSSDYKNLKVLFDSQILSQEEFENKTALLMVKVEENLNELENFRKKIIGTWGDKIGTIEFFDDNNFNFKEKNNYVTKGLWFLKDLETIVIRINSREEFFNIRNLEEDFFSYKHKNSIFKLNRL